MPTKKRNLQWNGLFQMLGLWVWAQPLQAAPTPPTLEQLASADVKDKEAASNEVLLDRVSILVDHIAILESDIQFFIKLLQAEPTKLESQKQNLKLMRKQAIDQLICFAVIYRTHQKSVQAALQQQREQMGTLNAPESNEYLERYLKATTLNEIAQLVLQQAQEVNASYLDHSLQRWYAEAEHKRLNPQLYSFYQAHADRTSGLAEELKRGSQPKVILSSQIDSEVDRIVQELLEQAKLKVEVLAYPIYPRTSTQDLEVIANDLKSIAEQAALDESGSESLLEALERAQTLNPNLRRPPHYLAKLNSWGQVPAVLKAEIKSFKPGELAGPIHEEQRITLYKVVNIQLEGEQEEVQKFKLRIFFKRESGIKQDPAMRMKLRLWKQKLDSGQLEFETLVREHSDALPYTKTDGLVDWKPLDSIGKDPKLHRAIEQLTLQKPYSSIFKGEEGWYLVQLLDKKVEETDFKEMESLKAKARKRITERSAIKRAEMQFEVEKGQTRIQEL